MTETYTCGGNNCPNRTVTRDEQDDHNLLFHGGRTVPVRSTRPADDTLPRTIITVHPQHGGDGITAHLPKRTAGHAYSGPTAYVTACGRYAYTASLWASDPVATCVACHESPTGRIVSGN